MGDYPDMRISNFVIENEKVRETVVACSYGAPVECF